MAATVAPTSVHETNGSNSQRIPLRNYPPSESMHENLTATDDLPPQVEVEQCANVPIYSADGQLHPFESLHSGARGKQLIIFVRHFFCGMCQDYIRAITSSITPEDLSALPVQTSITIIGCGSPDLINHYASVTECHFPIYADPTRKLYDVLGMTSTLFGGSKQPEYQKRGILGMTVDSIYQGLSTGAGALKGGNFSQNGGEFLFEDGEVTWCHRMNNTRDHTEVIELQKILGMAPR